jgi:inosine/xanthosine triphosphate pyrophosphatase family protein
MSPEIKKVLFGTHNPKKVHRFKTYPILEGVQLLSPQDINLPKVYAPEDRDSEGENALQKAKAYYKASGIRTVTLDTGFYIDGLPDDQQPGKHVQRVAGVDDDSSDEERYEKMIAFYSNLARESGGERHAYFLDVFCLFDGETARYTEAKRPVILTDTVYTKDVHLPVSCLYKLPKFDVYYHAANDEQMVDFLQPTIIAFEKLLS